jgi:hypothetical protein
MKQEHLILHMSPITQYSFIPIITFFHAKGFQIAPSSALQKLAFSDRRYGNCCELGWRK